MSARTQLRVGAIIEIVTGRGLAYGQLTHHHDVYGWLMVVRRSFYASRPPIADMVRAPHAFTAFVSIELGLRQRLFRIVGSSPISTEHEKFPLFRWGIRNRDGEVRDWWLWDGGDFNRTHVGSHLTPEQRELPLEELITPGALVARLESGWGPSDAAIRSGFERAAQDESDEHELATVTHVLGFVERRHAEAAAAEVTRQDGRATVSEMNSARVIVRIYENVAPTAERVRMMDDLARRHQGNYEGNEVQLARATRETRMN